jgi:predicted nucleic acid-binding protein
MVVVDTSVAIKWVFPEDDSDRAHLLLKEDLIAPDLLIYEFTNVLVCQAYLTAEDIRKHLEFLYKLPIQFFVLPQQGFERVATLCKE